MKKCLVGAIAFGVASSSFAQFVDNDLVVAVQANSGTADAVVKAVDKTTGTDGFSATLTGFRVSNSTAGGGIKVDHTGELYLPGNLSSSTTSARFARVTKAGVSSLAVAPGTSSWRGVARKQDGTFFVSNGSTGNTGVWSGSLTFDNSTAASLTQVGTANTSRIVAAWGLDSYVTRASSTASSNGVFLNGTTNQVATVGTPELTGATDLWISTDGLTMYVADERRIAGLGGVIKFTRGATGDAFTQQYLISTATGGTTTTGARFLSGRFDAGTGNFTIYASTNEGDNNRLVKIIDTGASSVATVLQTAGVGNQYRGVGVVPEPVSMIALGLGAAALLRRRKK